MEQRLYPGYNVQKHTKKCHLSLISESHFFKNRAISLVSMDQIIYYLIYLI